ncbi:hypothetical protein ACZ11_03955 [Lysinibacillus xylanilyticus]|uniref:Uncharacterized protein n=1 Tax=Lysinibacillus xylanilyticus TaxID=582475 RepID=A0A0K9F9W5_9BACI|nr:hypothetical protein [Lysinibacillus xylanilyticus]KMY31414.1 hypothetical protein ACZ11_03955 [Lysinibacillus xylanilyticus]
MKRILYPSLVVMFLISIFLNSSISAKSQTSENVGNSSNIENKDEGKVVFSYKRDFKALANFFNLTENEYFQMRGDKSMIEIAEIQGINKDDLFYYLVSKNYDALESAYNKGQVDLHFVMDYVLYLKQDVEQEMQAKRDIDLQYED